MMKRKKLLSLLLIALLVLSSFPFSKFTINHVDASQTIKKRVLEIVDSGNSQLNLNSNNFEIRTIRMKTFVALREELDGKYDLIVIGDGAYSTAAAGNFTNATSTAKDLGHNTTTKQNDMTNLKATEIINYFIEKGQLVVIHNNALNQNPRGKLYNHFNTYKTANKANVLVLTSFTNIENQIEQFYANNNNRPRLTLNSKPDYYTTNVTYQAGSTIDFEIQTSGSNQVTANFYIDGNFNHRYEANELLAAKTITGNEGALSYTLPRGYTGLRYWKLEIVDPVTRLKDYQTGIFKFKGELMEVSVLQVYTDDRSMLTKSNNMNSSFLTGDGYKIKIDTVTMATFNADTHKVINGKYDMVIFGFADVYNNASLTTNAATSVKNFIKTRQSVMFTHDTIYRTNNIWVNNFMNDTGQKAPMTDLGLGARQTSTSTKKINDGLLTQYPFPLDDNVQVATTHNQYYTLDLEDPDVIMWYNLIGGYRDNNDSWNHYYTYSKGNVTYSGTGHTFQKFPEEEQKLFVNTMYRAFLGSNTAPFIDVRNPNNGDLHYRNQTLELAYEIYDLDLTDRRLKTRIFIDNQLASSQENIVNGSIVRYSIPRAQLNNKDTITLKIEVEDQYGAITTELLTVELVDLEAEFEVEREIKPTTIFTKDEAKITYSITPKDITEASEIIKTSYTGVRPFFLTDRIFEENTVYSLFDEGDHGNFGLLSLGNGASELSDLIKNGYSGNLGVGTAILTQPGQSINSVKNELTSLINQPIIIPIIEGDLQGTSSVKIVNFAEVEVKSVNNQQIEILFKRKAIPDELRLTNLRFEETFPVNIDVKLPNNSWVATGTIQTGKTVTKQMNDIVYRLQEDYTYKAEPISFEINVTSDIANNNYVFQGSKSKLTMTDFRNFPFEAPFNTVNLEVIEPVESVSITNCPESGIKVGDEYTLLAEVLPVNASNKTVTWSSSNNEIISVDQNGVIKGKTQGEATITVTTDGVNRNNQRVSYSCTIPVHLVAEEVSITGPNEMFVGDSPQQLQVNVSPEGAGYHIVSWSSTNPNAVTVNNQGQISAVGPGVATVRITINSFGRILTDEYEITVKQFVLEPDHIEELLIGKTINLIPYIYTSPNNKVVENNVTWQSSNVTLAEVSENGLVLGKKAGAVTITAIMNNGGRRATADVTVRRIALTDVYVPTQIVIPISEIRLVNLVKIPEDTTDQFKDFDIVWTSDNDFYAKIESTDNVNGSGTIRGRRIGSTFVRVSIEGNGLEKIEKAIEVIISEEASDPDDPDDPNDTDDNQPSNGGRW